MFSFSPLTTTNIIEILGIIFSSIASLIAIIISVKTLKQNSKLIEESTRPYLVMYQALTNFQMPTYYLILKNFGQSGATICSIDCSPNLVDYSLCNSHVPFLNFGNETIAPGQSFVCSLDKNKVFAQPVTFHFSITYTSNGHLYSDSFSINPDVTANMVQTRASTPGEELKIMSFALQDLVEKIL